MFNSLRKKSSSIKTDEVMPKKALDGNSPKIELDLNEVDKSVMSNVQKQYLKDELNELKLIHKNDVDISPVYFNYSNGVLEVKVFIRNAFERAVNFDKIPFIITDKDGNAVAHKVFDLREVGDIGPNTAKPYKLFFEDEFIINKDFDCENLKIGFESEIKCFNGIETKIDNLPEDLSLAERDKYNAFLKKLARLEKDTLSMSAVELVNYDNGDIGIVVILRNGYSKDINVENIPIMLFDKNNTVVASGVFKSMSFKVKRLSASLYNLIFKSDEITNDDYDISTWHVSFKR